MPVNSDYLRTVDGRFFVSNPNGMCVLGFVVPYGFVSDGDTMPRVVRLFWDSEDRRKKRLRAAILHDYLYTVHYLSRSEADLIYFMTLVSEGYPTWMATVEWASIRLFGWMYWD